MRGQLREHYIVCCVASTIEIVYLDARLRGAEGEAVGVEEELALGAVEVGDELLLFDWLCGGVLGEYQSNVELKRSKPVNTFENKPCLEVGGVAEAGAPGVGHAHKHAVRRVELPVL